MAFETHQKLTVTQLKALCKENKISGYSKLPKQALIEKLLSSTNISTLSNQATTIAVAPICPTPPPAVETASQRQLSPVQNDSQILQEGHPSSIRLTEEPQRAPQDAAQSRRMGSTEASPITSYQQDSINRGPTSGLLFDEPISLRALGQSAVHTTYVEAAPKRTLSDKNATQGYKKQRLSTGQNTVESGKETVFKVPALPLRLQNISSMESRSLASGNPSSSQPPRNQSSSKSLVMGSTKTLSAQIRGRTAFVPLTPKPRAPPAPANPEPTEGLGGSTSLWSLDFPGSQRMKQGLNQIPLPPSVAQRKKVHLLAICLSEIDEESLRACILVSRLFRYAAYLSATWKLRRYAPGERLDAILKTYPENVTNLWPYLRVRLQEVQERRLIFTSSYLGKALGQKINHLIADHLWWSPDNPKQINIALRFLLTQLYNEVSVPNFMRQKRWLDGIILDTQEMVNNKEIWVITFRFNAGTTEVIHVLEQTCEVIGRIQSPGGAFELREDWNSLINSRSPTRLLSRLRWTNHEEYEGGISKHWLKRVSTEGEVGKYKRVVAERYILACIFANSLSGRWMPSATMEQEFNGLTTRHETHSDRQPHSVNLFVPSHHHVEGVYFCARGGVPLHPAVAVVQTPNREYYLLKDNGMQIGCEEEGVSEIWTKILECSATGIPLIKT